MAKWIKYQIVCNEERNILLNKKLSYNDANLAIATQEAYQGKYTIVEDDKDIDKKPLAIELGGTGENTIEGVKAKFGIPMIYLSPTEPTNWKHGDIWLCPEEE